MSQSILKNKLPQIIWGKKKIVSSPKKTAVAATVEVQSHPASSSSLLLEPTLGSEAFSYLERRFSF